MWALSTCGAWPPNEIKKNTHPKNVVTALFSGLLVAVRVLGGGVLSRLVSFEVVQQPVDPRHDRVVHAEVLLLRLHHVAARVPHVGDDGVDVDLATHRQHLHATAASRFKSCTRAALHERC